METVEWIDIKEVLADMEKVMEDGKLHVFSISWVRSNNTSGGPRGSIKRVMRASKYTKPGRKTTKSGDLTWQFKTYNMIPIQDRDIDKLQTPKYTHIIEYNGKKVRHYGAQ